MYFLTFYSFDTAFLIFIFTEAFIEEFISISSLIFILLKLYWRVCLGFFFYLFISTGFLEDLNSVFFILTICCSNLNSHRSLFILNCRCFSVNTFKSFYLICLAAQPPPNCLVGSLPPFSSSGDCLCQPQLRRPSSDRPPCTSWRLLKKSLTVFLRLKRGALISRLVWALYFICFITNFKCVCHVYMLLFSGSFLTACCFRKLL